MDAAGVMTGSGGAGASAPGARYLRATRGERVTAALVAAVCLAMLVVGASLRPSERGHGTHTQLGLPPCGWVLALGKPCPTCGMTTSVSHAARGELVRSLRAQPMGLVIAIGAAVGFWLCVHTALTGSRAAHLASVVFTPRWLWGLAALAAASWGYKWVTWDG